MIDIRRYLINSYSSCLFRKTGVRLVGNFFDSRGPKLGCPSDGAKAPKYQCQLTVNRWCISGCFSEDPIGAFHLHDGVRRALLRWGAMWVGRFGKIGSLHRLSNARPEACSR